MIYQKRKRSKGRCQNTDGDVEGLNCCLAMNYSRKYKIFFTGIHPQIDLIKSFVQLGGLSLIKQNLFCLLLYINVLRSPLRMLFFTKLIGG